MRRARASTRAPKRGGSAPHRPPRSYPRRPLRRREATTEGVSSALRRGGGDTAPPRSDDGGGRDEGSRARMWRGRAARGRKTATLQSATTLSTAAPFPQARAAPATATAATGATAAIERTAGPWWFTLAHSAPTRRAASLPSPSPATGRAALHPTGRSMAPETPWAGPSPRSPPPTGARATPPPPWRARRFGCPGLGNAARSSTAVRPCPAGRRRGGRFGTVGLPQQGRHPPRGGLQARRRWGWLPHRCLVHPSTRPGWGGGGACMALRAGAKEARTTVKKWGGEPPLRMAGGTGADSGGAQGWRMGPGETVASGMRFVAQAVECRLPLCIH